MILRKERTHHTGSSNLLTKTERLRPVTQPGHSRLSLLSMPKVNQVDEVIERKAARVIATPFEKTRSFYGEQNKPQHPKTKISQARTLQLEDPDKMKMPFTGESLLLFDQHLGQYRDPDSPIRRKNKDVADKEHLAKEKHEIHAKAIQETQLVGYDNYGLDTLKNNVNLQKVREAKRLLRRKYANRKNMHMIFSSWDYDRTGSISIANLYTMAKRLGLNLNYDEARVLLASADRNGTATLSLDEFLDLIHNKDDMLNLDLDKLAKYSANYHLHREELEGENDENIIKQLEEDAKKGREVKHFNQVNLILKNKINEIVNNFLLTDPHTKGYTTYDTFEQNLRKLNVDEKLISNEDIKVLFNKYKTDDHTIHYKYFIDGLKGFNFLLEDAYKELDAPAEGKDLTKNFRSAPVEKVHGDEPHIDIVDVRSQPYSTVYTYLAKKRKVSRLIQKFFPNKDDLKNYLTQTLNVPRDNNDNLLLSKNQTRDAIVNLFKKFDIKNLTQRDFEGFLSTFVYNKHDYTQMNEVLNGIYDEDEDALIEKVNTRKKGPPPHKDLATEGAFFSGNDEQLDAEAKQKKINEILNKIDERIFVERKRAYDLYKMFDVDKDGFISRKDFITKAEEIALVPKNDIKVLVDYLDSQNKGYVNFREFHQKIYTNATQQDENANPKVFPSVMPSKENFLKTAGFGPMTKKKVEELINEIRPQTSGFLRPSSRFGSTPAWKNTFHNMQPGLTSPMFVSDRDRFNCSPQALVLPSFEEKEKKRRIQSAKIDVLKVTQATVQRRADEDMHKFDQLDQNRLKTKVTALATHEQNARLRNNYS